MKDVAAETDDRGIPIDRVGIRDLHLPVRIMEKNGGYARVVGQVEASVKLPHVQRGTHMSRFLNILGTWSKQAVSMVEMEETLGQIVKSFDAPAAHIALQFKYFLPKTAPVSGQESQLDYDCGFEGEITDGKFSFILG
ncbi:MAG: GTP cyclohydrolase, FolE2/MptA family, partial [Armatimonadota bacterium]